MFFLEFSFVTNEAAASAENIRDECRVLETHSIVLSHTLQLVAQQSIAQAVFK